MFLTAKFLKLNVIFYLIQQLLFVPHLCVYAFLDFETKEFINGKVFRAAILHVYFFQFILKYIFCFKLPSVIVFLNSIHQRLLLRKKRTVPILTMALQLKFSDILRAPTTSRKNIKISLRFIDIICLIYLLFSLN